MLTPQQGTMIELYTWTTPNGRKASIMLEEIGLPYNVHSIDISKDEQFKPEFLKISPNNRIPAIVDTDTGISLMESGALMIYLADKTGKLLPKEGAARYKVIEWLMWQMGGIGPMLGQVAPLPEIQQGQGALCRGALLQGSASALWRARPPARGPRIRRRHLLDRRHRDLAVDLALRVAGDRHEQISQRETLVCRRSPTGRR